MRIDRSLVGTHNWPAILYMWYLHMQGPLSLVPQSYIIIIITIYPSQPCALLGWMRMIITIIHMRANVSGASLASYSLFSSIRNLLAFHSHIMLKETLCLYLRNFTILTGWFTSWDSLSHIYIYFCLFVRKRDYQWRWSLVFHRGLDFTQRRKNLWVTTLRERLTHWKSI